MRKQNKAAVEKELVQHLARVGIRSWCKTYDRGRWYYCFWLESGETRYWTNLSDQSKALLKIDQEGSGE